MLKWHETAYRVAIIIDTTAMNRAIHYSRSMSNSAASLIYGGSNHYRVLFCTFLSKGLCIAFVNQLSLVEELLYKNMKVRMFITWVIKPERNAKKRLLKIRVMIILVGKAGAMLGRGLLGGWQSSVSSSGCCYESILLVTIY